MKSNQLLHLKQKCVITHVAVHILSLVEGIVEYIAACIVQKVTKFVLCKEFSLALVKSASERTSAFLIIQNNGGLVVPSVSVIKVVKHCEVVICSSMNTKKVVSSKGINTYCFLLVNIICTEYVLHNQTD